MSEEDIALKKEDIIQNQDLNHSQQPFTKTEWSIANKNLSPSQADPEKLLSQHQQTRKEIDSFTINHLSMMEFSKEKVTADPSTSRTHSTCSSASASRASRTAASRPTR